MTSQKENRGTGKPTPRSGALKIPNYIAGGAGGSGATKSIKLSSNESALGTSPAAIEAYVKASKKIHRYPDAEVSDLRVEIAKIHGIDTNQIVFGGGSDELLQLLALGYAGPGDDVIYTEFGFVVYPMVAHAVGANPIAAKEKYYGVDVDILVNAVTPETKIVFIANPNSTGTYLSREEMGRLHNNLPRDVLLVIDAAYAEFANKDDYDSGIELVCNSSNTVMTRTFSKAYGLAALRLGWCFASLEVAELLNRIRGPFNVSTPAQLAGIGALRDKTFLNQVIAHNSQWREWLSEELTGLSLEIIPSSANFVLARFPGGPKSAEAANNHLLSDGIYVRDMNAYGLYDCLRITVGLEQELKAMLKSLKNFLKD